MLIATYTAASGGSGRILLDVATGLAEPPVVACPEGPLAGDARAAGLLVFTLRARSIVARQSARDRAAAPLRLGGHARELRRLIDDLRPQTFVAWGMRTLLAAVPALRGMAEPPRLVFQHNDFVPDGAIGRAVRAAARRADAVICLSHAVADDLGVGGAVVHPGVDASRFERGPGGDGAICLGAIVPWKRPDLALEVAARAQVDLTVAGAPLDPGGEALLGRLQERARQPDLAGRVRFTGELADPRPALAEAGCLLHCADREPFGMVLLEAMASGLPVVAPAAGGPTEIVDGESGALYPPGDAAAAAAAVESVLARRDRLAPGARERVEREFTLTAMQERYRELLAEPAGDRYAGGGLAIVTVAHNSAAELRRLLASVGRHLPAAQVIVADSGSGDDSASVARDAGAEVVHLDNVGFGRATNAALVRVERPVTALVNPDVELVDASLSQLARDARPDRLLAPLILNPDGTRQDSAHVRPVSAAAAVHAVVPPAALPRALAQRLDPWRARRPRPVGWAIGACLVAPTDTLRALGPFDESIFLYAEDLELGLRARRHGVETWFRPDARVVHDAGHSTAAVFGGEAVELLARQRHEVVERSLGGAAAAADDLQQLATFATRGLVKRALRRPARRERLQATAVRKARKRLP